MLHSAYRYIQHNVIAVRLPGARGRAGNHTCMASGLQFSLKTVFAALYFTRMSSVPHLSAIPPIDLS